MGDGVHRYLQGSLKGIFKKFKGCFRILNVLSFYEKLRLNNLIKFVLIKKESVEESGGVQFQDRNSRPIQRLFVS